MISIAISRGRILKESLPLLAAMGIKPQEDILTSRKLVIDTNLPELSLVVIRATDVPTYVQRGAADMGIAGKDVLLEFGDEGIYEPLDLKIAKCRMMVAGPEQATTNHSRLRVATKYPKTTKEFFARQSRQVELIRLYGSMELAPILGLSDLIVDLVDTGNTLKANGLKPLEHIADISSRLIINKASMKLKSTKLKDLLERFRAVVDN